MDTASRKLPASHSTLDHPLDLSAITRDGLRRAACEGRIRQQIREKVAQLRGNPEGLRELAELAKAELAESRERQKDLEAEMVDLWQKMTDVQRQRLTPPATITASKPTRDRGHAPRQASNTRTRGSARAGTKATQSRSSSDDPPGDPEPAERGRWCRNPAHQIFGGGDLSTYGWVHSTAKYCHRNCKEQASKIRTGKLKGGPKQLASPPPGWGRQRGAVRRCECKHRLFGPDGSRSGKPALYLMWLSPRESLCGYCGRPVLISRLIFGSEETPKSATPSQMADLIELGRQQRWAKRQLTEAPSGAPVIRTTAEPMLPPPPRDRRRGENGRQPPRDYFDDLDERKAQARINAAEDEAISEAGAAVAVPDRAEVERAAEAFGLSSNEAVGF